MSKKVKKTKDTTTRSRRSLSTLAATRRRLDEHSSGFVSSILDVDTKKLFSIKDDTTLLLDILPYEITQEHPYGEKGWLHYERTFYIHRNIGVDNETYVCPRRTTERLTTTLPCPICEALRQMRDDPSIDPQLIGQMEAKERQLFNVIDLRDPSREVKVWESSYYLFGQKIDEQLRLDAEDAETPEEADAIMDFASLDKGSSLRIGLIQKKLGTNVYYEGTGVSLRPRKKQYDESMLDKVFDLDKILKILSYEELAAKFAGSSILEDINQEAGKKGYEEYEYDETGEDLFENVDDEELDEEEVEVEKSAKKKTTKKKAIKKATSKKKATKKKAKPVEEDEDDFDEDIDDVEDDYDDFDEDDGGDSFDEEDDFDEDTEDTEDDYDDFDEDEDDEDWDDDEDDE